MPISIPDRADVLADHLNGVNNTIQSLHAKAMSLNESDLIVVRRADLQSLVTELTALQKLALVDPTVTAKPAPAAAPAPILPSPPVDVPPPTRGAAYDALERSGMPYEQWVVQTPEGRAWVAEHTAKPHASHKKVA
jgi:hypothetical protein